MISEPSQTLSSLSATDRELAEVLDRYLVSLEKNTPLDVERLIAEHPRLATDIRAFVASVDMLHGATQGINTTAKSTSTASLGNRGPRSVGDDHAETRSAEKRLGDFEIGPEIGRGGMGVVYEATQISLQRKVALKVLPFAAMWDHKQIARFQNEAQAAAQLHHPHIVPVFAVGQERGVHFYAMQLIQGRSLDAIVGELRRETASEAARGEQGMVSTIGEQSTVQSELSSERAAGQPRYCQAIARLGIQAATALHYAHECGVVHRDIKPSNLMVDARNKLWITDFGLARIQDSPGVTLTGDVVGTLRYMSPEQVTSKHALVDPRTDIYALGASLYELLTLQPAFPGEDRQAVMQAIPQVEPLAPRAINPSIPVDLETIVLQAMAKAREDRYATAEHLADDLNRFLEGKPTLARRPTLTDRATKWVWRHRAMVSLAAVFLLLLTAVSTTGAILLSREHSRKQAALANAEENLQQARQVVDRFGSRFSQELAKLPGSEPLRLAVLGDTLAYYQEFIARAAGDPKLKTELATTHFHAGTIASQLGDHAKAKQSFRQAADLFAELAATADKPTLFYQQQATALNNIALLFVAEGKLTEARDQYTAAIRLQSAQIADGKEEKIATRLLAELYTNRGLLERQSGEPAAARRSLTKAIALLEKLAAVTPEDSQTRHALAMALNNRSFVEQESDWQAAEGSCRAAVELFEQLVDENSGDQTASAAPRSDLALSYNNLAAILGHLSKDADAIAAYRQAVGIQEQLVRQAPSVVQYRSDLAITWNNLAQALARQEMTDEAARAYDQSQTMFAELVADFPQDIRYQSTLAGVLNNRGMASEVAGDLDAALTAYRQAIEHQRIAVASAPEQSQYREFLSKHYFNCGRVLRTLNRPADALALALERRALWEDQGKQLYQVALELAAIAESIDDQASGTPTQDDVVEQAVATLRQAELAGFEFPTHDLPAIIRTRYEIASKIALGVQP